MNQNADTLQYYRMYKSLWFFHFIYAIYANMAPFPRLCALALSLHILTLISIAIAAVQGEKQEQKRPSQTHRMMTSGSSAIPSPPSPSSSSTFSSDFSSTTPTGDQKGFCVLPEAMFGWSAANGCNGEPQFLSSFCADHVKLTADAIECVLDENVCESASGSGCSDRQTAGVSLTSREEVYHGNISIVAQVRMMMNV
jgi:hypothetical protein